MGTATRERIMTVAERLFAERGIDAVSIRDVTAAAGANNAAVHYHFGSKLQLIRAILERRAPALTARRDKELAAAEALDAPTVRDVVLATVTATADMAADREHGGLVYLQFLANLLNQHQHLDLITEVFEGETERTMAALARVTPHLTTEQRELRWALAKSLIAQVLGNPDGPVPTGFRRRMPGVEIDLVAEVVDFLTAAFSG